jgi:hypothetical protein
MFAEIASIAGPVLGGLLGADGASDAAAAQGAATRDSIAEQRRQFDISRSDLAPYRNLGSAATMRIGQLLGLGGAMNPQRSLDDFAQELRASGRFTRRGSAPAAGAMQGPLGNVLNAVAGGAYTQPEGGALAPGQAYTPDVTDENALMAEAQRLFGAQPTGQQQGPGAEEIMAMDPGYQFRLNEGQKGIDRRIGAMGLRNSGAALKAMTRFGQDYASNEFGNVFNRLSGAAGTGQAATNTGAALGAQNAQTVGGLMSGLGNARGAAAISGANAMGGALNTVGNYFGQQQMLDKILNKGGVNPGGSWMNNYAGGAW